MTRGFYDQLGVEPSASAESIRQAYLRLVAQFRRRRQALLDRGGDPDRIELARRQADEAYAVLSNPERRRRYDAMLALLDSGMPQGEEALWDEVQGAVVPEAIAAAVELLRATTDLQLETFPEPPGTAPEPEPEPEPLPRSVVVPLPQRGAVTAPTATPSLRVVDGSSESAPVIVMPTLRPPEPPPEPEFPPGPEGIYQRLGASGQMLREVREHLGHTLDDVSEKSRIAVRFLQAIEEEAFDRLPSATFVRGYVREFSAFLDLDEDEVVEGYMERFHGAR